ncbi:MAG: NifB/NifX family molybdenum-iron cluster-binding protein [Syntrophaceae bacterium]|nr:NifB/NifX family molybdenum-iron cluster-binding protein [Deltaproteobacteria bacterium]
MKIAVSSTGPSLDAQVEPRFGRCPWFLVMETDTMEFQAMENPNIALGGGAGIQAAQFVAEKGITHVLTGNCGPNAHQALSAAGITIVVGCSGVVRDMIEKFKSGRLSASTGANVADHFGMGQGLGRGGGMGMRGGRGMGRGGGRGRG